MTQAVPFTVLIPARRASTRLPDKPLADIGGLPMVVRVAQRAALSSARWRPGTASILRSGFSATVRMNC